MSHFPFLPLPRRASSLTRLLVVSRMILRVIRHFYSWAHADVISFLYTCTATTRNVHIHSSSSPPRFLLFLAPPRPLRRPINSHINNVFRPVPTITYFVYININIHHPSSLHCLESNHIFPIAIIHTHSRLSKWRTVFHNLGWLPWICEWEESTGSERRLGVVLLVRPLGFVCIIH